MNEIFLQNKYHVIPTSLFEKNRKARGFGRRILLTGKEHFIVHWLLTKFTIGEDRRSMQWAMAMMQRQCTSSMEYQKAKEARQKAMTGRFISEETLRRVSLANKGKKRSPEHGRLTSEGMKRSGYVRTPEHNEKLAASHRGKKRSLESRERMRISALKRQPKTIETRMKASASMKETMRKKYGRQ